MTVGTPSQTQGGANLLLDSSTGSGSGANAYYEVVEFLPEGPDNPIPGPAAYALVVVKIL